MSNLRTRLPLVGEITYNRGNEEFVGGRGNLRGKGNKVGEMLENVRGLIRNCLIDNQMTIKDQLYSTKFVPLYRTMACNLVSDLHAELSMFI